eukprot:485775-Prorocentrum_minimum.AAC.2
MVQTPPNISSSVYQLSGSSAASRPHRPASSTSSSLYATTRLTCRNSTCGGDCELDRDPDRRLGAPAGLDAIARAGGDASEEFVRLVSAAGICPLPASDWLAAAVEELTPEEDGWSRRFGAAAAVLVWRV